MVSTKKTTVAIFFRNRCFFLFNMVSLDFLDFV